MKCSIDNCPSIFAVPKDVTRIVAELNDLLGGPYFVAIIASVYKRSNDKNINIYKLSRTRWAANNDKKYEQLCADEMCAFRCKEFKAYITGLINGLTFCKNNIIN